MYGFPIMPDYARFPYHGCKVTASMLAGDTCVPPLPPPPNVGPVARPAPEPQDDR